MGWGNNVHVPVHTQAQQPYHLSCSPADTGTTLSCSLTGGVGWGGVIPFMFLCTHRHSNLLIFLALQQTQALLFHDHLLVGWGGVMTFIFLRTHMHSNLIIFLAFQQSHLHLSADGVGWGGVITFMFLCTHRHSNLIIFLALQQTQALLFHDHLPVGWGAVG